MLEDNNFDLEQCVTASTKQNNGFQPSPGSKADKNCALAVQHLDGRALLINVAIEEVDGDFVFGSARRQILQAIAKSWHQSLVGKLFMGLVVGIARVKQVTYCRPPISPSRVYLQDFTLDPLLTEALHNPDLLLRTGTYSLNVSNFGLSSTDDNTAVGYQPAQPAQPARMSNDLDRKSTITCIEHNDQEIIVVKRVIDRAKIAWLLILLLSFSPLLGIGVGICSHNADVGIAVSAGIFALASFVQGLVAWVQG